MNRSERSNRPAIFDSHAHLYSQAVIASVRSRKGLADSLCLSLDQAASRTDTSALKRDCSAAGVHACLLLPTAPVHKVGEVNDLFLAAVQEEENLFAAGTLHPSAQDQDKELERLSAGGVRALKLCSFSQGFDLESPETLRFFEIVRAHNHASLPRFFVILDTFYQADVYFGAPKAFITTPRKLNHLVKSFPEIDFVGAHMGGLAAPFSEIQEHLAPHSNLYLDTSNAAHVLSRDEFLRLLHRHGPQRILFGTDWPWFGHQEEVARIGELLNAGDLSQQEQSCIFSGNIRSLLGI
jgi:uncharacterized protein